MSKNEKCTLTESVCIHITIAVRLVRYPRCLNVHAVAACPHTTRGQCARILYSGQGTKLVFFTRFVASRYWPPWVKHNEIKQKTPSWSQKNWIHKRQKLLFSTTELAFWRTTRYEKTCTSSAGGWRNASLSIHPCPVLGPDMTQPDWTGGTDRHSAVSRLHPRPAVSIDVVGHTRSGSGRVWDGRQRGGWVERWHHTCVPRYTGPATIRCNDIANGEQKL